MLTQDELDLQEWLQSKAESGEMTEEEFKQLQALDLKSSGIEQKANIAKVRAENTPEAMNKQIEEERTKIYKEENPILSKMYEIAAPHGFKKSMQTGSMAPNLYDVGDAALGAGSVLGAAAIVPAAGVGFPLAIGMNALGGATGTAISKLGGAGLDIAQGTQPESIKDIGKDVALGGAIGGTLGGLGEVLEVGFSKVFNANPKFMSEVGPTTVTSIKNKIQKSIESALEKAPEKTITPEMIQQSSNDVIDELGKAIPEASKQKLKRIIAEEFAPSAVPQQNMLSPIPDENLYNSSDYLARLKGLGGGSKYEDPLSYVMGEKGQARVLAKQGLERAIGSKDVLSLMSQAKNVKEPGLLNQFIPGISQVSKISKNISPSIDWLSPSGEQ
jgi:hypothetical protein